jgi:hypothetical protein
MGMFTNQPSAFSSLPLPLKSIEISVLVFSNGSSILPEFLME